MKKIISLILCTILLILPINITSAQTNYSIVKEPIYNMADSFFSNVTKVSKGSLWGICDTNGYLITDYHWEAMGTICDSLIPAKSNGLWGYIDYNGAVQIPYQFQKADNFSGDLARVLTPEGKYAYINRGGEIVFVSPFDYSFSPSEGFVCGIKDGLYGYCDTSGNIVIHPQFEIALDFYDGRAAVKFGGKWGYISGEGKYVVNPTYTHASDFSGGFAVCSTATGYGIIDTSGTRTSAFTFEYIGKCDEQGRFPAKRSGACGYINSRGEWILKLGYEFCYNFTDGVARVFKNNSWGYIDESGNELIPPSFADCGEYKNGRAFYSVDGLTYGFLTLDTTVATNPTPVVDPEPSGGSDIPAPGDDTGSGGTSDVVIGESVIGAIPLFPPSDKTVSMKIGSRFAIIGGRMKTLACAPALIDDITMVPLRDLVESMGGEIIWEPEKKRTNISFKGRRVIMSLGSKIAYVNGVPSTLPAAPILINDVTMIPVRSVATGLGCDIEWIGEAQNIYVHY